MATPVATLTNMTGTGDVVAGPGAPTFLALGMPVALIGDSVSGAAVVGVLTSTTAVNKIVSGKPMANLTSVVTGANPVTGVPVTVPIAVCTAVTKIV